MVIPLLWLDTVQRTEIETMVELAMGERQDHAIPVVQVLQEGCKREGVGRAVRACKRLLLKAKDTRDQNRRMWDQVPNPPEAWCVGEHADKAAKLARPIGQRCAPKHAPAPRAHSMPEAWSVAKQHTGLRKERMSRAGSSSRGSRRPDSLLHGMAAAGSSSRSL